MAKKGRPSLLNRKPRFAVRVTVDGKRVWKTASGKIYDTKKDYFNENKV